MHRRRDVECDGAVHAGCDVREVLDHYICGFLLPMFAGTFDDPAPDDVASCFGKRPVGACPGPRPSILSCALECSGRLARSDEGVVTTVEARRKAAVRAHAACQLFRDGRPRHSAPARGPWPFARQIMLEVRARVVRSTHTVPDVDNHGAHGSSTRASSLDSGSTHLATRRMALLHCAWHAQGAGGHGARHHHAILHAVGRTNARLRSASIGPDMLDLLVRWWCRLDRRITTHGDPGAPASSDPLGGTSSELALWGFYN